MAGEEYALEMKDITKRYHGVKALEKVNFCVKKGTVHALMGENGAGKSTLMKVLAGITSADEGEIYLKGKQTRFNTPRDSLNQGISMIQQELAPVVEMMISENLFLGRESCIKNGIIVDFKKIQEDSKKLLKKVGLKVNPRTLMKNLTVAQTQMVEIAKAIDYNSDIIIMDEPTSAIADKEVETLFDLINQLKNEGKSIIYITHKIDEVFKIADEITILRDGQYIGTFPRSEVDKETLIRLMVDRELTEIFPERPNEIKGEVKLSVRGLTRGKKFRNISFDVCQGEILGLAGLLGSGRTETVECLFGITKPDAGEIFINGEKVNIKGPSDAIEQSIGLVTEDRKVSGLILPLSVKDNITLPYLRHLCRLGGIIRRHKEANETKKYIDTLKIKTTGSEQLVQNLSGGNQQKVVLGKWLMTMPSILIFDEPTRGIDVGAKTEIYQLISDLANQGITIIFISSEMEEILGMCDRILVFHEGRISGELLRKDSSQQKLLNLAMGMVI